MINNVRPAQISSARRDHERHQEGKECGCRAVVVCMVLAEGLRDHPSSEAVVVCKGFEPVVGEGEEERVGERASTGKSMHRRWNANHD